MNQLNPTAVFIVLFCLAVGAIFGAPWIGVAAGCAIVIAGDLFGI